MMSVCVFFTMLNVLINERVLTNATYMFTTNQSSNLNALHNTTSFCASIGMKKNMQCGRSRPI